MTNGYNGWRNYETWRVNLELFSTITLEELGFRCTPEDNREDLIRRVADSMESLAHDIIEGQASGWSLELAQSFLMPVDWDEMAAHMVDDALAEIVA